VLALAVGIVVVAADQVTKTLVVSDLTRPVHLLGPLGLSLGYNSGSAFSLFTGWAPLLVVVALLVVGVLLALALRARRASVAVALGLVLGGALGNVADRLFRGHHGEVVDFITFTHWPTFNVADACITVGILLLIALTWRSNRTEGTPDRAPIDRAGGGA
jgi:signal peptidase II